MKVKKLPSSVRYGLEDEISKLRKKFIKRYNNSLYILYISILMILLGINFSNIYQWVFGIIVFLISAWNILKYRHLLKHLKSFEKSLRDYNIKNGVDD